MLSNGGIDGHIELQSITKFIQVAGVKNKTLRHYSIPISYKTDYQEISLAEFDSVGEQSAEFKTDEFSLENDNSEELKVQLTHGQINIKLFKTSEERSDTTSIIEIISSDPIEGSNKELLFKYAPSHLNTNGVPIIISDKLKLANRSSSFEELVSSEPMEPPIKKPKLEDSFEILSSPNFHTNWTSDLEILEDDSYT